MFDELIAGFNPGILKESLGAYFQGISVSTVVMSILALFVVVGLVDKLRGNKLGYGEPFEMGYRAMGDLAMAVVGIVALSPVLLLLLKPVVTPVYEFFGASPAMFPSFIALDMGGYALSIQLAGEADWAVGQYSGVIVASMLGITVCFTVPYALRMMKKEDHPILGLGVLIGIVTMPVGCLVGGLLMFFTSTPMTLGQLIINTLPVIILAVVVALGLWFKRGLMLKIFVVVGKIITFVVTVGPVIAVFQYLTGIRLPLFYKMVEYDPVLGGVPLEVALLLVGQIAIVLLGAFPLIHFLNKRLGRAMDLFGKKAGINHQASTGLLTQLASSIPVWSVIDKMNDRGKLFNIAFAVSGSFVLGDVLAFTGGVNREMIFPVIVAKLTAGICAIILAAVLVAKKADGAEASKT